MFSKFKFLKKDESGQALLLVALLLPILIGFAAIVIDYSYMVYQKNNLQVAADSAALAGALEIPKSTDDTEVRKIIKEYMDSNTEGTAGVVSTIDRTEGKVTVDITQMAPKIFAGFITSEDTIMSAHAQAKYAFKWSGEALPFINLDDDYAANPKIEVWENIGKGQFESMWKDEYKLFYEKEKDKTYFTIDYQGGITITDGEVANLKQEIGNIYEQKNPVYLFSLSSEAIKTNKYSSLKNKDVIPSADIVLLQVTFDSFDEKAKNLYLTVTNVYNLKTEFPKEYLHHTVFSSKLIE